MPERTLKCPNCGREIPLSETLYDQVKESIQREFEEKTKEAEDRFKKREQSLLAESIKLQELKQSIDKEVAEKIKEGAEKLRQDAIREAELSLQTQLKDMQEQITEKDKKLQEAQENELSLRKRTRELEDAKKGLELEVQRRIDEEREKIRKQAIEMFTEEHRLKDLQKDKKISDMERLIDELKRKVEQGPIQAQGEVLELDLESFLKSTFPTDEIEPVPQGMRGADIIQKVYSKSGQHCGTIIWETKRTKNWSDSWISKLKDDQRTVKAEIAVIVSAAMPDEINSFGQKEGVWVCNLTLAGSLAEVLRSLLLNVALTRSSAVGKNEKMEMLYSYLSGTEFRHKVEAIVEAFVAMRESLEKEKKAYARIWAQREKHLERAILSTAGMYGDMQGIIGASLPEIKMLALESRDEAEEFLEDEEIT